MEYNEEDYRLPGRPPKDPDDKVGVPIRCLTTQRVRDLVFQTAKDMHISPSDIMRLAIFRYLESAGLVDGDVMGDATWDVLKQEGYV